MNLHTIYFSPTYTTEKVVKEIVGVIAPEGGQTHNITIPRNTTPAQFTGEDFVLVGIPVYSGRVPRTALETLTKLRGAHTPVALVATFGNRHFDDALLELKTVLEERGFIAVAAAAFVTEHSVVNRFGEGRPNTQDVEMIHKFADEVKTKMDGWQKGRQEAIKVDGNPIYRKYMTLPIKPHAGKACTSCGVCAVGCPTGAISPQAPKQTDKKKCVTCMRCVKICPQHARGFSRLEAIIAEKSLEKMCTEPKHSVIFI